MNPLELGEVCRDHVLKLLADIVLYPGHDNCEALGVDFRPRPVSCLFLFGQSAEAESNGL